MATAKNYTQFTPGTFDPTQIILQANATTGILSKIPLNNLFPFNLMVGYFNGVSSGNPTPNVIYNNFSAAVTITRTGTGLYRINNTSTFFSGNGTSLLIGFSQTPSTSFDWAFVTSARLDIKAYDSSFALTDTFTAMPFILIDTL